MPQQTLAYRIDDKLYLNITDRCTLHCHFCPKHHGTHKVHDYDLTLQHRPVTEELINAIDAPDQYREIVFCGYGEPTLRLPVLLDIAAYIKAQGGRTRLNTDGLANRVHKRDVLPELGRVIDALSVSMNAADEAVYNKHCQPALDNAFNSMLDFLGAAPTYITDVTATAIDGLEGVDIAACQALATRLGVKFRRRILDIVG